MPRTELRNTDPWNLAKSYADFDPHEKAEPRHYFAGARRLSGIIFLAFTGTVLFVLFALRAFL